MGIKQGVINIALYFYISGLLIRDHHTTAPRNCCDQGLLL